MKDIIIEMCLLWLVPSSIITTKLIIYNLRLGILKDDAFENRGGNNDK